MIGTRLRDALADILSACRWLGVDHVFLTDNSSKNFAELQQHISSSFDSTFVTLRSEQRAKAQLKVYAWCAETQRQHFNYIAFFDLDEYLVLRESSSTAASSNSPDLKGFLDQYKHSAALAVHWVKVGPSDRETRVKEGGVLQHYTQCIPQADAHFKSIVNTWYLDGVTLHPHNFRFRCGLRCTLRNSLPLLLLLVRADTTSRLAHRRAVSDTLLCVCVMLACE